MKTTLLIVFCLVISATASAQKISVAPDPQPNQPTWVIADVHEISDVAKGLTMQLVKKDSSGNSVGIYNIDLRPPADSAVIVAYMVQRNTPVSGEPACVTGSSALNCLIQRDMRLAQFVKTNCSSFATTPCTAANADNNRLNLSALQTGTVSQ